MPPAFTGSKPYISSTMLSNVAGIFKDTIGCWNMSVCSHCHKLLHADCSLSHQHAVPNMAISYVLRAGSVCTSCWWAASGSTVGLSVSGACTRARSLYLCQELVPVPGACTCASSMYLCHELL